ncbi:MAG: M56 family metallopeptidase, partial [Planctomycetes bacterium]|nr:M56 family metallopeptidase [Planctomycetota bacterium]
MAVDREASALLAWLGTYFVHSTLLLTAAWIVARVVSRSRRFADAQPAIRVSAWRVALLAGLVTATVQRGLDVDGPGSLWTIAAPAEVACAPLERVELTSVAAPRAVPAATTTQPAPIPHAAPRVGLPRFVPLVLPSALALIPLSTDAPFAGAPLPAARREAVAEPTPAPTTIAATAGALPDASVISWPRTLLTLWLLGVAAGVALWVREWRGLHRRLRGRVELDRGPVHAIFARLCERTGTRGVRLSCAPALAAPITLGLLRSEVVIPPRANTQLSPDELEALFAHELAHVNRADPLWLVVYRALEVVFFFQPLNRLARVLLDAEAELLADDWAAARLESRVSLASCLTEIAGWIVRERRALPAPAMAARGTRLTVRVRRLLDEEHHPENARRPSGLLLLAGLAVTGVALFGPGVAAERPRVEPVPGMASGAGATAPAELAPALAT